MKQGGLSVKFWGVRGSYAVSDRHSLRYGGHTSCVEVRAGSQRIIMDAGTGIINLGKELVEKQKAPLVLNLLLSHTHHDHLFGFYFFDPFFDARNRVFIFGPASKRRSLAGSLRIAMDPALFPIRLEDLDAEKLIYSLKGSERIVLSEDGQIPSIKRSGRVKKDVDSSSTTIITYKSPAHPNGVMLYRVCYDNKSVVYATDIEEKPGGYSGVIEFARGADLLIHDAQYLESEYFSPASPRKGWGHSTVERAAEVARKAGVKQLALFHHEPTHDDPFIDGIEKQIRRFFPATVAAAEGMVIRL
ncbi:MAG: MBL fold metallo-hydrolase [Candidatus Binatia bacterium]